MSHDNFVKVFDVLDSGFKDWIFSAFGLIFVVIATVIFFFPRFIKTTGIPYMGFKSKWYKFLRYYGLGFALLWTSIAFYSTYSEHQRHQALAQSNTCRIVEGPVENFFPMPYTGHAEESFSVSGIQFKYSDYIVTDGFNNTSSHGGPLNKDSYVRICYDPSGNQILRLEIRDFKGQVKDYSKTESLFPKTGDFQGLNNNNPIGKLPWYSKLYFDLFFIIYIIDFLARFNLFLPYLKTFFCLKRTSISACNIPLTLKNGKNVKFRNTIIYWDREDKAMWLRPRGFNQFQVPLLVAKLNTDEFSKSIINQEILFSSGFPFIMILFFWTAYQFFSLNMPTHNSSPALFVGFALLIFTVIGFLNLKRYRSRMEILVQDALSELKEM